MAQIKQATHHHSKSLNYILTISFFEKIEIDLD